MKTIFTLSFLLCACVFSLHAQSWSVNSATNIMYSYPTTARVAIGTTAPRASDYKLDVSGITSVSSLVIQGWGTDTGAALTLFNSLKTASDQANQWKIYNMTGQYGNSLQFWSYPKSGSGASRFRIMDNGNVGIGSIVPEYKLDVSGAIQGRELFVRGWNTDTGGCINIHNDTKTGGGAKVWKIFNMTGQYNNALQFWAYGSNGGLLPDNPRFTLADNGNVGIGTQYPGAKLDVIGTIRAHEVKVCLNQGCDFVFEEDYDLMSISDLSKFIKTNKHLPDVAPAAIMEDEGINVSEMNALLLQKIEELTLYMIQQQEEILIQRQEIDELKAMIK